MLEQMFEIGCSHAGQSMGIRMGIINHLGASAITFNQPINLEQFIKQKQKKNHPAKNWGGQRRTWSGKKNVVGQIASNNRNRSLFFVVINTDACLLFGVCSFAGRVGACDLQRLLR